MKAHNGPVHGARKRKQPRGIGKVLSKRALAQIERQFQITCLRRDGYTVKEIADTLNCAMSTVHDDLIKCLNRAISETSETTEQNRQLQIERLDALLKTYMPLSLDTHKEVRKDKSTGQEFVIEVPPNPAYATLILNIETRRSKLLALDVPEVKKLEVSGVREYIGVDVDKV